MKDVCLKDVWWTTIILKVSSIASTLVSGVSTLTQLVYGTEAWKTCWEKTFIPIIYLFSARTWSTSLTVSAWKLFFFFIESRSSFTHSYWFILLWCFQAPFLYYCSQKNCWSNPAVENVIIAIVSKADVLRGYVVTSSWEFVPQGTKIAAERDYDIWEMTGDRLVSHAGHFPALCMTLIIFVNLSSYMIQSAQSMWEDVCAQVVRVSSEGHI